MAGFRFISIEDPAALAEHAAAWEDLAANALEPNLFYEPWVLRPALDAYAHGLTLSIVLVYATPPGQAPLLCGLFPLERRTQYRGLPMRHLALWRYRHCFLATPLLRRRHARECLAAFLEWLADDGRGLAMEWGLVAGDGPFFQVLRSVLNHTHRASFLQASFDRALLRPLGDSQTYIGEALRSKARREFRRQERRLAELGPLEYVQLGTVDDAPRWIDAFLGLEARGWKGRRASALGCSDEGRDFFTRTALEAARRGRLMMLGLYLAGEPIALKCNFLAQEGSFAFKIAYDERYARFSPGVLLELENIRRFHAQPELRWMDSCAAADHFMVNRLWLDRRRMVTLLTAARRFPGDLLVSALPMLRWCYRSLRGPAPAAPQPEMIPR
jgi:CelD/BcsL family acetyltransferase involved in cellulose biosynthesis